MELSQNQLSHIMKRFPEFELCYETITHNKVSIEYDVVLAIPTGKKAYVWFTFHQDNDICYVLDINKDKKITKAIRLDHNLPMDSKLSLGTLLYGTIIIDEATQVQTFIVEDIYFYNGISLKKSKFIDKLCTLEEFFRTAPHNKINKTDFRFVLPLIWKTPPDIQDSVFHIPEDINKTIGYPIHHIQYRPLKNIMPYLNAYLARKINVGISIPSKTKQSSHQFETVPISMDFNKPQYKYSAIFQVTADMQFDIYHLFAYGKNKMPVYYNVAYVPNYKTSVFLNQIFRKIRENENLDYIEESDDEEDFQNMEEDKYVDMNKVVLMECVFQHKFKKWIPTKVVDHRSKVVHLKQLVKNYY